MPADDGVGLDDEDGVEQTPEPAGQGGDQPAVKEPKAWSGDAAAQDDELLAEQQVLGQQHRPGSHQGQQDVGRTTPAQPNPRSDVIGAYPSVIPFIGRSYSGAQAVAIYHFVHGCDRTKLC